MQADGFPRTERFEDHGLLGRGGMGVVYRAFDRAMQREVALKTLPVADPDRMFHLKQEFRVVADLTHENLVRLHDLVIEDGQCFFTMELLDGPELLDWIDAGDPAQPLASEALERVARALVEIAAGVTAIHDAGMLHRDIKPANVRVRRGLDGDRVVLLDFGVVAPIVIDAQARHDIAGSTGTPAYMSPEAMRSGVLDTPSDWYSVGCVAYEALTGRCPVARSDGGAAAEVPPPSTLRPGIPAWLDDLVLAMLDPEPTRRAGGARVREVLGAVAPGAGGAGGPTARHVMPWGSSPTAGPGAPFVGRRTEMDRLSRAFASLRDGGTSVVHCYGDSGIGKSELLHRFAVRAENEAQAVTLRGRCHLHESVPYKAVDQVVDDLTRYLMRDETPAAALVPPDADALCRLFPVLQRVPELAARGGADDAADPHVIRRRAAPASENPLLESLRGIPAPDSPAERIDLPLSPLGAHEAKELTSQLLGGAAAGEDDVAGIAAEAAGSPFFIGQLARYLAERADVGEAPIGTLAEAPVRDVSLADVVARRLDALSPLERRLVEIVSVAVGPVDAARALAAAGGSAADRSVLQTLAKQCLLRTGADLAEPTIQTYHAKIAEATVARLAADELAGTHRTLADLLAADPESEPDALVPHLVGAGDFAAAARAAVQAGDRAAAALAFERAAQHYELALEHGDAELDPHRLRVALAEALVNAGHTPRAAEWFERAADALEAAAPGSLEASALRRRAAEHYVQSGLSDKGSALMRAVLAGHGVRMPESTGAALRAVLWARMRLRLRGTKPAPHRVDVSPEALERMDAIWSVGRSNGMNSVLLSGALVTRHLLMSLDLGEPKRVILGLGMEATWCSGNRGRMLRHVEPLLAQREAMIEEHGDAYERASGPYIRSVVAWTGGEWAESARQMEESIAMLRAECPGTHFEVAVGNMYLLSALALSGEIEALAERAREELRISDEHRDLFGRNACIMGEQVLAWLVTDEHELALRNADEAVAAWTRGGFFTRHYHYLIASVQTFLYRGEAWRAWQRIVEIWPEIQRAHALDMEMPRIHTLFLRAQAALAAANDAADPPLALAKWSRKKLRRQAERDASKLARASLPLAAAHAATIRSGLAAQAGDREAAAHEIESALAGYDAAAMPVHRESVRARLGACRGGGAGEESVARAHAWLTERGVVRPERLVAVFAPPVPG